MIEYGFLSLVPPALSIVLAIYTRNVIVSLTIGAFSGSLIIANMNPFFAATNLVEEHIFAQLSSGSNAQVLVVMLVIGGFVKLLDASDGAKAFATTIGKYISSPKQGQFAAWSAGLGIFFTDSGNALIVGPLFGPIFRRLKICKEKLAYIIDTTASPVSLLVPITGWGVYVVSLIENSFQTIGVSDDPFQMLLTVWPFQFYAILVLLSIPMILITGRELGPMAAAQAKHVAKTNGNQIQESEVSAQEQTVEDRPSPTIFVASLLTLLFSMTAYFAYFAYTEGVQGIHVRSGICISYILASIACAYVMRRKKNTSYGKSLDYFIGGMGNLVFICIILVLAWSLSSICQQLQTGEYLASLLGDNISPNLFPVLVFVVGAVMSFATGSSYGTFAVLMAVILPVAHIAEASLPLTIAAILSGGLFGDHTSPISDTTVLASMGAECGHIEHVNTQMVYALFVGILTAIAFVIAGFYESPIVILWMIVVQFVAINVLAKVWGRRSF